MKNVVRGVVAELKINALLSARFFAIEILIQDAIPIAVRARCIAISGRCSRELIHMHKALHQFFTSIDLQDAIDPSPVLNGAANLILSFLSAGRDKGNEAE